MKAHLKQQKATDMALSSQHKRTNKNRVSITYDVEHNGEVEQKELPFVIGVIGDYSGHKSKEEKIAIDKRQFTTIDNTNFDDVVADIAPKLNYKVDNTLLGDGSEIEVDLTFSSIADFHPEKLIDQVDSLKEIVNVRNQLKTLLSKSYRSSELEEILKEILQSSDITQGLADELQLTDKEGE